LSSHTWLGRGEAGTSIFSARELHGVGERLGMIIHESLAEAHHRRVVALLCASFPPDDLEQIGGDRGLQILGIGGRDLRRYPTKRGAAPLPLTRRMNPRLASARRW
jgi:hypothetical protein